MSILAVNSLQDSIAVTQTIYTSRNITVDGIRVHMLKLGVLTDGTITLLVKVNGTTVKTLTKSYTEFNTLGTEWHGMKSWAFDNPLIIKRLPTLTENTIEFVLTISSHTDSDTVFLSIVKSSDVVGTIRHIPAGSYYATYGADSAEDVYNNPYDIELYTLN